ncbi:RecBCD enzyme subunit RecD [Buchnera aphidicola (Cinara piceae)]|uniref:RecBCD enzyme subunit RecD n=1 Tax=Buchnera aphidicola (Cinara piceae) TaxID=1660043 RepID=A0A803FU91_9GAMM|nr:exodeoxyribonuclease V subunit alpha [Buchnera aphidicola]VFP88589.1 RecBCD enzyme subunit RecD [Buchnera aphidicola (Cinara piceae)]
MISKNKKKFFKIIHDAKKKNIIYCIDFYFCFNKNSLHYSLETILVILFLSHSIHHGHSCLPITIFKNKKYFKKENKIFLNLLKLISKNNKNWFHKVINSISCSNGTQKTPLVLERGYIYIYKYWYSENKITEFIYHQSLKINNTQLKKYKQLIHKYCPKRIDDHQKRTIQKALLNHIFFIIGGPGTGKTCILAYLILILINSTKKKINIQLSAPTGKAATKLTQSIFTILNQKNINKHNKLSFPKIGVTLHHLFQINKETNQCNKQNKEKNKKIDVLIIDESSMIDLNMMDIIVNNINKKTKIIFVGDIHQLPSIEVGSVLKELCTYKEKKFQNKKNIYNQIIKKNYISVLKKKYRFNEKSGISILAKKIENNQYYNVSEIYKQKYSDVIWKKLKTKKNYINMLKNIKNYYTKYLKYVNKKYDPKKIIKKFNKYRILCTVNKGIFGTKKINKYLDKWFIKKINKKNNYKIKESFYHGKPILIKKNNTSLQLMNGDIGICLYSDNKIQVYFILPNNKLKIIDPRILFNYESAWSMTIHKSQGSEFSSIQIILPNYFSKILCKELFYTAITRAKKKVTIYGCVKVISNIIKNKKKRFSGLNKNLIY